MSLLSAIAAAAAAKGDSRLASRLSISSATSAARQAEMRAKVITRRLAKKELSHDDDRCVLWHLPPALVSAACEAADCFVCRPEVTMLEYMAATNHRPVDLKDPIRVKRMRRKVVISLCITMYNVRRRGPAARAAVAVAWRRGGAACACVLLGTLTMMACAV
jgi:hypothetical protein